MLQRINVCIDQIKMRLIENKVMLKNYPSVLKMLSKIEESHIREVIIDLMAFYKKIHTIQIQRYLLISRNYLNKELFTTLND